MRQNQINNTKKLTESYMDAFMDGHGSKDGPCVVMLNAELVDNQGFET